MFGSHSAWVAASLLQASSVRHLGRVNLATDSTPPAHAHECLVRLVAERGRQFGSTLQASKQLYLECRHLSIIYLSTFVPRQSRMSPRRRPVVFVYDVIVRVLTPHEAFTAVSSFVLAPHEGCCNHAPRVHSRVRGLGADKQ